VSLFPGCTMQIGSAGVASCVVSFTSAASGSVSYVARYDGDTRFLPSTSTGLTFTVDAGPLPCTTLDDGPGLHKRLNCYYSPSNRLRSTETFRLADGVVYGYAAAFRDEPGFIMTGAVTYSLNSSYRLTYLNKLGFEAATGSAAVVEGTFEPGRRSIITRYTYHPNGRNKSSQNRLCVVPTATGDGASAYYERYWDVDGNVLYDASGNDHWNIQTFPPSQCPTEADVEAINTVNFRDGGLYKLYVPR
jgi:hypothetical protein